MADIFGILMAILGIAIPLPQIVLLAILLKRKEKANGMSLMTLLLCLFSGIATAGYSYTISAFWGTLTATLSIILVITQIVLLKWPR